jgi:hypothetical protein
VRTQFPFAGLEKVISFAVLEVDSDGVLPEKSMVCAPVSTLSDVTVIDVAIDGTSVIVALIVAARYLNVSLLPLATFAARTVPWPPSVYEAGNVTVEGPVRKLAGYTTIASFAMVLPDVNVPVKVATPPEISDGVRITFSEPSDVYTAARSVVSQVKLVLELMVAFDPSESSTFTVNEIVDPFVPPLMTPLDDIVS